MTEGIVNILKPPGMTSSDAVADVRHIFKIKRVGHTGTLDPGAAGVLQRSLYLGRYFATLALCSSSVLA